MTSPLYLDVHALQTLPYSNVNRDDLGSPKTVVYGGKERTRVSSQSWKRAVRHQVEQRLGDSAVRTRRLIGQVAERLVARGWDAALAEHGGRQIVLSVAKGGIKLEKEKEGEPPATSVLFYLPVSAIDALAGIAADHKEEIAKEAAKKTPKAILPGEPIVAVLSSRNATVNLFGRMLAELPSTEVDGAVQFAHAFTVHGTAVEVDFFTAVDDVPKDNDRGSGHMNAGQFSAGTFYRYANIDLAGLLRNLDGDAATARELVTEFLRAFVQTVPSGKQNATAAMTLPDLVHVAVRADRPVSFAPAFETALYGADGYAARARDELDAYARRVQQLWWQDSLILGGYAARDDKDELTGLGRQHDSYPGLIDAAVTAAFQRDQA
ncbi:type I-E CRISPR-associated protein Cas7/Cse4/CasC [Nocardiopsis ansamitocini]|uniref:Type I-E CRISPR-associated protein Cas7/Cse4/CasC n=1 Tax=Nocardiopsis ansamitocini TaxID=1670832 RepID=A0A9W6PAA5_9ACTN|nr:type I-E CRISPR-associated protein Cas7/Cse4/CasC [Nocardiopsis ansamitocini]GLU49914.1 type I-E CRISPR-associated protein Cas7/Cse4/CasC [Nocardiopsis ansamitocini]